MSERFDSETSLRPGFFHVSAERVTHGREHFTGEVRFATRAEALIECRSQNMGWHCFVDGSFDCPPSFARVRNPTRETQKAWILNEGGCRQIEQPGSNDAAAPPHFGD